MNILIYIKYNKDSLYISIQAINYLFNEYYININIIQLITYI